MLNAVVAEDQLGSSSHSRRGVAEKQVEYISLKKRLRFTARERAILADHVSASTERDELLPRSMRSYGTSAATAAPIYRNMMDPESTRSSSYSRQGAGQSSEDDSSSSSCCCSDNPSAGRDGVDLNSIFCAGKPIWYFR